MQGLVVNHRPSRWKLCLCLLGLAAASCTQVARSPRQGATPWWEGGNPPQAEEVQQDTSAALSDGGAGEEAAGAEGPEPSDSLAGAGPTSAEAAAPDSLRSAGPTSGKPAPASPVEPPEEAQGAAAPERPAPSPEVVQARRLAYEARTREDRERVQQVNEYALWCVERGLWDEARIHLEQAVALDSLAASLHNNLAILYERLGEREKARTEYEFAARLAPDKRLYQANLGHLRRAVEGAGRVPADSVDIDGLPPARERRRGTAPARETPEEG